MNDKETNYTDPFEGGTRDIEAAASEAQPAAEGADIYSEPDLSGEEKKQTFTAERSYEGYFKTDAQPSFSEYNPYATEDENAADAQPAANPYVTAEFETKNVQAEPVSGAQNEQTTYNPYASPRSTQQFSANYQQQPPFNANAQNYNYQQNYYAGHNAPHQGGGKGKKVAFGLIAACVVIAVIAIVSSLFGGSPDAGGTTTTAASNGEATTIKPIVGTTQSSEAISNVNSVVVADKVRPSVVGVMTYLDGQLSGEGSGVLWAESDGYTYVVTCAHVIDEAGVTYGILMLDGKTYEAEMVACDTRTDIGVLKINVTGLPLAEVGDSSALKIGEPIYAIGNPGGSEYFGSITDGIVSAIDRSVSATYTMTCIQHNAAINPGNSGGALVNTAGQIVGINSSKIASTEYEGMGFAVPTSIAVSVVDSLIQYGYVPNRPKLGIEYAPVSAYQLYSIVVSIKELPKGSLVIAGISQDSSLKGTKAQVGDLIIGVNGKKMDDSSVLLDLIDTGAVGDTLTLTLCRVESRTYKTSTFDVTITLVEDKGGTQQEETTTQPYGGNDYDYGGAGSFEDFFNDYFGFGW